MHIWDIDHTYLNLPREELKKLIQLPLEAAQEGHYVPGSTILLRRLQHHSERLAFISTSPEIARANLKRKMRTDGIIHPRLIMRRKISLGRRIFQRDYNDTPGFKLLHLLRLLEENSKAQSHPKSKFPGKIPAHRDYLMGTTQDWDMFTYLLCYEILQKRATAQEIAFYLSQSGASNRRIYQIIQQSKKILYGQADSKGIAPPRIILQKDRSLHQGGQAPFYRKNPVLRISRNHFQTALFLYLDKVFTREDVLQVAQEITTHVRRYAALLTASLADLYIRGYLSKSQWCRLGHYLWRYHLLQDHQHRLRPCFATRQLPGACQPKASKDGGLSPIDQDFIIQRSSERTLCQTKDNPQINLSYLLQRIKN